MTIYKDADLDLTNTPPLEAREWCRIGDEGTEPGRSRLTLQGLLSHRAQPVTERLAKLKRAVVIMRTSIDPGWWAVALLMAVMVGGFTWLSAELHRIEAKVDAVSLRLAELPGTLEGDLQAQTERLTALISAERQSGSGAPPGGRVTPTPGAAPAPSHTRSLDLPHIGSNLPKAAADASGAAARIGAASSGTAATAANRSASTGTPRRP